MPWHVAHTGRRWRRLSASLVPLHRVLATLHRNLSLAPATRLLLLPALPQVFEFQPDPGLQTIRFERPNLVEAVRELGEPFPEALLRPYSLERPAAVHRACVAGSCEGTPLTPTADAQLSGCVRHPLPQRWPRLLAPAGLRPDAASLPDIDAAQVRCDRATLCALCSLHLQALAGVWSLPRASPHACSAPQLPLPPPQNLGGWAVAALCRAMSLNNVLTFLTAALLERQVGAGRGSAAQRRAGQCQPASLPAMSGGPASKGSCLCRLAPGACITGCSHHPTPPPAPFLPPPLPRSSSCSAPMPAC